MNVEIQKSENDCLTAEAQNLRIFLRREKMQLIGSGGELFINLCMNEVVCMFEITR